MNSLSIGLNFSLICFAQSGEKGCLLLAKWGRGGAVVDECAERGC